MRTLLFIVLSLCFFSCSNDDRDTYSSLTGETMGTYYKITYDRTPYELDQEEVDQLLVHINNEVSTYIDTSIISRFNQATRVLELDANQLYSTLEDNTSGHFMANFMAAKEIYKLTKGYFDPTVMPLVNYWGFGYSEKKKVSAVDSIIVDSLLQLVGFEKVEVQMQNSIQIKKDSPGVQLDFSALAKGYAVDKISELLEQNGVNHYMVDIGGEIRAKGLNAKQKCWTIGVNVPTEDARFQDVHTAMELNNKAVATSGNYRNFYEVNGVKYSHTISPDTGFPERNNLLSASIFAEDCMTADAFATACMTMGLDLAYELISRRDELEAFFIYGKPDGSMDVKYTSGLNHLFD